MSDSYKPRLRHFTMVAGPDDEALQVVVGTEQFEIMELAGSRTKFLEVKSLLDGRHTIDDIAGRTGVSVPEIAQLVADLSDMGILRSPDAAVQTVIPVKEFIEKVKSSCIMWQRQIGYHRLFSLLLSGKVRKEVFTGYLLESYHYVHSARKHIATAISYCKTGPWREMLVEYFVEEYDHGKLYLNSLEKIGFRREDVVNAHPIIGTMSLINMLCEIARTSTIGYLACTCLFEANKEDFTEAKSKLEFVAGQYGIEANSLAGVISHMEEDIKLDHKSILEEALAKTEMIDSEEAHYAVNCLHDLKHSFDQFHDQILQYYGDISNYIPRLKVDYFSL